MTRFLVALPILLLVATGVSRPAAPPVSASSRSPVISSTPLLSIREMEKPCPCLVAMLPESTPEKRTATFFIRVTVQVPFTEAVYVPRTTRVKRLVYREVPREVDVTRDVYVPVVAREKQLRAVYREQSREEVVTRQVYVPVTVKESRRVYRKITRKVPVCQDAYVPIESREKKTRMVYVNDPVRITRTVPAIRMVDTKICDPSTGKMVTVQKPVCEHRQVTEMVDRYVLQCRVIEETVTRYRLERRTEMRTVEEYVLDPKPTSEDVVTYRLENRPIRETVKSHVLGTEVVMRRSLATASKNARYGKRSRTMFPSIARKTTQRIALKYGAVCGRSSSTSAARARSLSPSHGCDQFTSARRAIPPASPRNSSPTAHRSDARSRNPGVRRADTERSGEGNRRCR